MQIGADHTFAFPSGESGTIKNSLRPLRSQIDPNTDANVWRGYARFVAGFNDWRGAYAGGITGGASL